MPTLGTPLSPSATRLLMLGAGELGKEVVIEAQRLGVEVIAADRYPNAPAMQVAHRSHVLDMLDPQALRELVLRERPALIVPEIEAIATPALVELERGGLPRDPDGAGGPPDDGPRGNPAARRGGTRACDLAVPVRVRTRSSTGTPLPRSAFPAS